MPVFRVTVQGKTYHVEVPDPGVTPLRVIVDGQSFEVDIAGTEVTAGPARRLAEPPSVAPPLDTPPLAPSAPATRPAVPAAPFGPTSTWDVLAPMPGTLLSLEVNVGQHVEQGQVLCVLEAMKMKNPIRATQTGTVAEILVQVGQTVPHGAVLLRLG